MDRDFNLLPRCFEIQISGAYVIIDLAANILRFSFPLTNLCVCLRNFAFDARR